MKKLITFFLALSLFSCNDGDFDVPSFDFTDTVNNCGEYILYKKNSNSTEALILTLGTTQISNTVGEVSYAISSSIEVNYRIFEDGISTTYFCQAIPPSTPKVLTELVAESATITITTTEKLTDGLVTGYSYDIAISDLLFSDNGERIFFENLYFGVFEVNL